MGVREGGGGRGGGGGGGGVFSIHYCADYWNFALSSVARQSHVAYRLLTELQRERERGGGGERGGGRG